MKIDKMMSFQIYEDDLEYLFDEMVGKKLTPDVIQNLPEKLKQCMPIYKDIFQNSGAQIVLDVTNLFTYAIIKSPKCIECLYKEIKENDLYIRVMEAFNKSQYKQERFEDNIEAKEIAPSRLMRGLLVLFRNNKSSDLYQIIMRIIVAGFSKRRKALKKYQILNGEIIREIQSDMFQNDETSVLLIACEQVIVYVLAEDLGMEIDWDFRLMSAVRCLIGYGNELSGNTNYMEEVSETTLQTNDADRSRAEENLGTSDSMEKLIYGKLENKFMYLVDIMCSFHVSPRKLHGYKLNSQEIKQFMVHKDKWNTKDYMYCMIISIICKYISSLEQIISEIDIHEWNSQKDNLERHQKVVDQLKEKIDSMHVLMKEKEFQYNKSLLEQEREISNLQNNEQALMEKISIQEQELKELRNYVYGMQSDAEQETGIDVDAQINNWMQKRVIVFGGHSNWQRKLKEKFPQWQFVGANVKSFTNDYIRDKEYIVCNTDFISHASYYKIIANRDKHQRILYVRSSNMDLCMKELCMQL